LEIRAGILAFAAAIAPLTVTSSALGKPLDPTLSRLVLDPACNWDGASAVRGRFQPDYFGPDDPEHLRPGQCVPDEAAFKKLVSQWGFIIAPTATHTARTTGYGGFQFSLQAAYTKIDADAEYWKLATEGERDPDTKAAAPFGDPPDLVSLYSINAKKSFGFGLETAMNLGFLPSTSLITGGADVRLSLLEGFRRGIGGALPDVAIGTGARTMTGTAALQLTTLALDVVISKPFTIADFSVLSPWIGFQRVWIFADSGVIDLTPATDPLEYCGYGGASSPGAAGAEEPYEGDPVCNGGERWDFANNRVFERARLERTRVLLGLSYSYEILTASGELITDLVAPADAQTSDADTRTLSGCNASGKDCKSTPRQWAMVLELGVAF
jgi:hypothetical protein